MVPSASPHVHSWCRAQQSNRNRFSRPSIMLNPPPYTHTHTHAHTRPHTHAHTHTHARARTHTHTHTRAHTHKHTHTQDKARAPLLRACVVLRLRCPDAPEPHRLRQHLGQVRRTHRAVRLHQGVGGFVRFTKVHKGSQHARTHRAPMGGVSYVRRSKTKSNRRPLT